MSQGDFLFSRWRPYPLFVVRGGREHQQPLLPPYHSSCNFILTPIAPPPLSCPGSCSPQARCPGPLRASWGSAATSPRSWGTSWQVGGAHGCMHARGVMLGRGGGGGDCLLAGRMPLQAVSPRGQPGRWGGRMGACDVVLAPRKAGALSSPLAVYKVCAPPSLLPRQACAAGLLRRGLPPALPGGLGWWSGWSCDRAGCGLVGPVSHGSFRQVDRVYIGWLHC